MIRNGRGFETLPDNESHSGGWGVLVEKDLVMKSKWVTVFYGCVFLVFCFHFYMVEDSMRFQIDSLTTELDSVRITQGGLLNEAWLESRSSVMERRYGL